MNRIHRWYCRSEGWRRVLGEQLVPWALGGIELGGDVLEVGPGPGLVTDLLAPRAERLTSLEIDPALAATLAQRTGGTNVQVIEGDATDMPFEDDRFTGAVSLTMLHHVPSPALQDRLLREVHRVLAPGGVFAGSDSTTSPLFRAFHWRDTLVPVDPDGFGERLERAGFRDVHVGRGRRAFRFRAQKAAAEREG